MSQEYDEFQQTGAGWWIRLIGCIVYAVIIVAYAWQTLELVNWLFPADNLFMKIVTVFVCDGCATGYAMAEMFYRFRLRKSKHLTFGLWIVTFILSTAATVIQMYLSSTHNIPHSIDPTIITLAYGLVIVAFVVNILTITVIIRLEYGASQPVRRYLDDQPKKPRVQQPAIQSVSLAQTETVQTPPALPEPSPVQPDIAAIVTAAVQAALAAQPAPLQGGTAPDPQTALLVGLDVQQSQNGTHPTIK